MIRAPSNSDIPSTQMTPLELAHLKTVSKQAREAAAKQFEGSPEQRAWAAAAAAAVKLAAKGVQFESAESRARVLSAASISVTNSPPVHMLRKSGRIPPAHLEL